MAGQTDSEAAALFVSVTGETELTERQEASAEGKLVDSGESVSEYVTSNARKSGLEEAIDEPETDG